MEVIKAATARAASHGDVILLCAGQPSTPAPAPVLAAAASAIGSSVLGYTEAVGIRPLRAAIATHYASDYGLDVDADEVVVTTGSSGAFLALFLAQHAWSDLASGGWPAGYPASERTAYDPATIRRWMEVFYRRFFANQFKRSAMPNGPKVVAGGSLSPRGDWRMPSDASAAAWLADLHTDD